VAQLEIPVDENTMYQVSVLPVHGEDPAKMLKAKDVAQEKI
jgi:hypothetical protein